MIKINTSFNPFRMKLSRREPVAMRVELVNESQEQKMLTMRIRLSNQLSFEKGGYKTEHMERLPKLMPGEKKEFYYNIFPKAATKNEDQPISIEVLDHYQNFNYVAKEYKKTIELKIED